MISIWEEGMEERQPNLLKKDKSCQVLILGANLAGLFTAFFCKQKGLDVMIAEEGTIDQRAMEIDFFEPVKNVKTWAYSIRYPYIFMRHQIQCHWMRVPAFCYWLDAKPTARMPKQPVFHPLEFMREMAALLEIYEQVPICSIQDKRLVTEAEYIHFEHVIDARKPASEENETWIAVSNVHLDPGIYLCMDGDAHFLVWQDRVIMRSSYQFLFPESVIENEWEVNFGRKEGIYESMRRAGDYSKEILKITD